MPTPEEYAKQREDAQRKREHQAFLQRVRGSCGGRNTKQISYGGSFLSCDDDDD